MPSGTSRTPDPGISLRIPEGNHGAGLENDVRSKGVDDVAVDVLHLRAHTH